MPLAHAFGQRYELPIPLLLFVLGGGAVVLVSFGLVSVRGPQPTRRVEPQPTVMTQPSGVAGLAATVLVAALIYCGQFGSQAVAENVLPTFFWLLVWIGVPLTVGVLGDWTRPVNAFAFLGRSSDSPRLRKALLGSPEPLPWPSALGWWPAVALFFCMACGELVFNLDATVPANIALALLMYAATSAFAGCLFGTAWLERGEVFSVLFATWGRLGYFRFGAPGRRGFAGGLGVPFEASASRIAFVLLLLVSVNFDGLLATPRWTLIEQSLPWQLVLHPGRLEAFRVVVFAMLALTLAVLFGLFANLAARVGRCRVSVRTEIVRLLPSLVPIAFAYLVAHNIEYVVVNGQLMLPLLGNPAGVNWWPHLPYPFNDNYEVRPHLLPNACYWYVAVVAIIVAHVVAVVLAHRTLNAVQPDRRVARDSEFPWLAVMVAYTMVSLWLIAQPLVKEHATAAGLPAGSISVPAAAGRP